MGQQDVRKDSDEVALREFTQHLIKDVRALERMLREGLFETGVRRIGAEQELFLVDDRGKPGPIIDEVLENNTDDRIVTELTRFNLEFNMEPISFGDGCLREMEEANRELIGKVRELVHAVDGEIIQTGILQTIQLAELTLDYMTPRPRYYALNDAITRLRGGPGQFQIRGVDELFMKHDTIMLEGCNTSFQTHFQVSPDEFPRFYNIAQAVAGPCLAAATNSPLLFGKRLWRETRIALFEQAVDTRSSNLYLREMSPRVHFGSGWVKESVTEIFKEDISRFRVLITTDLKEEEPLELLEQGEVPQLEALQLHNGTVYRWNRACYGISENGKPHLRIENRVLPSGPTVADEIANAAFWLGLMNGVSEEYGDVTERMDFDDARGNFIAAARLGMGASLTWMDGESWAVDDLVRERLLPLAREGLRDADIDADDLERYLGIIESRADSGQTGSAWILKSLAAMKDEGTPEERLRALTGGIAARQRRGDAVHEWDVAGLDESGGWQPSYMHLEGFMTTDLHTVNQDDAVELVANLMAWHRLRYIPVEDDEHRLVGLVSDRTLLRFLTSDEREKSDEPVPVSRVMKEDLVTASPDTPTLEAIDLMRRQKVPCLPVVQDGRLVGLVTEHNFLEIAGQLLTRRLEDTSAE